MDYSHQEIGQLIHLLQDEIGGGATDPGECQRLAARLADLYPEIAGSMALILSRIGTAQVSRHDRT